jgi:hypothetical protein
VLRAPASEQVTGTGAEEEQSADGEVLLIDELAISRG